MTELEHGWIRKHQDCSLIGKEEKVKTGREIGQNDQGLSKRSELGTEL